jgi:general secretion pathway protein I
MQMGNVSLRKPTRHATVCAMSDRGCRGNSRVEREHDEAGSRGFSLIEALVALMIVSMVLAAIANLTNVTLRSVVHIERSLAEVEIAQQLVAIPPPRGDIAGMSSTGLLDGHEWRVVAEPFQVAFRPGGATSQWVSAKIKLSVRKPGGAWFNVESVRLLRPRAP